jgi:hypothetical protein
MDELRGGGMMKGEEGEDFLCILDTGREKFSTDREAGGEQGA